MKLFSFIIFLLFPVTGLAQQITLAGQVVDNTGEAVYAANVYLENNPTKGAITDFNGEFRLEIAKIEPDETLIISFIGYVTKKIPFETFNPNEKLKIVLQQDQKLLDDLVVEATDPVAESFSVKKLDKLDIYTEPVSQGDPLKAITVLPASTNTDESANPSLRGSPGDRSRVFLNGVPIFEPVRFSQINGIGVFSLFNTEIVGKQYVYASNPPVSLGNSSAGIVQIETIRKLPVSQLQLSAGLANTGAFLSHRISEKSFVQLYANNQFADIFLDVNSPNLSELNSFSTKDVGLNVHSKINDRLSLNLYSYASDEGFDITTQAFTFRGDAEAETIRNFSILNLDYKQGNNILSFNSSYDIRQEDFTFGNILSDNRRFSLYHSLSYQFVLGGDAVEIGLNHNFNSVNFDDLGPEFFHALSQDSPTISITGKPTRESLESYMYSTWNLGEKWIAITGVRSNFLKNDTQTFWTYQLGMRFNAAVNHSFLLSGGRYHNFSVPNPLRPEFTLQNSTQIALDYEWTGNMHNLTGAIFYKEEDEDLLISNTLEQDNRKNLGLELSYTQLVGKSFRFYVANTFLHQRIDVEGSTFPGQLDLNYFVKTTLSYENLKLINASLTYITRPGTRFTEITNAIFDPNTEFFRPEFSSSVNNLRLGEYHNLSLSVNKIFTFGNNGLITFLSINNFLNIENEEELLFNRNYSSSTPDFFELRTIYFGFVWNWNY